MHFEFIIDFVDYVKAMEELVKQGLTRSIGVSNFNEEQIKRVLDVAEIKPVNNQVCLKPYYGERYLFFI